MNGNLIYEGEWHSGQPDGMGVQIDMNGQEFKGKFDKGKKVNGMFCLSNGDVYLGDFENDLFNGMGKINYK